MLSRNFDTIISELDTFINQVRFDDVKYPIEHCTWMLGKAETLAGFAQSLGLYNLAHDLRGYELTCRDICNEVINEGAKNV